MDSQPQSSNSKASSTLLILAAGTGSRFGAERQKCLAPLHFGEGPLQRLLRQLALSGCAPCPLVVTGHDEDSVVKAVQATLPAAAFAFNPSYADGSLLGSLCVGLSWLEDNLPLDGAWVLFGDSLYQPQALERILLSPTHRAHDHQPAPLQQRQHSHRPALRSGRSTPP